MNLSRLFNSAGLIGAVLGLASLPIHLLISHEQSVQLAGVVIAVIGAIYVGFALQLGSIRQISVEIGAACLFLGAALIGICGTRHVGFCTSRALKVHQNPALVSAFLRRR